MEKSAWCAPLVLAALPSNPTLALHAPLTLYVLHLFLPLSSSPPPHPFPLRHCSINTVYSSMLVVMMLAYLAPRTLTALQVRHIH